MTWEIDIIIEEPYKEQVSEEWLRLVIDTVMVAESLKHPVQLSLLITGDETVHDLNYQYRQIDSTTDVLAFAFEDDHDFPRIPDGISHLGEVIISYAQADRQATEQGHSVNLEIAVLTIHGTLHLLGYDHMNDDEERNMKSRETVILKQLIE